VVERAFVYCDEDIIGIQHLPQHLYSGKGKPFDLSQIPTRSLEKMEKDLIELCLWEAKGNKSLAAKLLEISRSTLHSKMKKYEIGDSG
jgi:transcriptional regulator of acetoin/glycerol metabolism